MTSWRDILLQRLVDIAEVVAGLEGSLALIGAGSVGSETARLDDYSDLDFLLIVEPSAKTRFLERLDWLATVHPIAFHFRNTDAGYKLLFVDGIFCEMAVFTAAELLSIPVASEKVIWCRDGVDLALGQRPQPVSRERSREWLLGEALTNLYVGVGRFRRGEKITAVRFIQGYAVDRVLELAAFVEPAQPGDVDPFNVERRFEQRFPQTAAHLSLMVQGYEQCLASAAMILDWLETHFDVDAALRAAIRRLLDADE